MTVEQLEEYQAKVYDLTKKLGGEVHIKVELDNFDKLTRIFIDENDEVLVENCSGTEFEVVELSEVEFSVLVFELEQQLAEFDPYEELNRYKKGFNILMEYFDDIPDEDKEEVGEKLEELDL